MKENIIALVQARMGSTRLPGKVLMQSCEKPLLSHLYERLSRSKLISKIIIATSLESIDDQIASYCIDKKYLFFRGSEKNVLLRFTQAAKKFNADIVVRITADCPLIDYEIVDKAINIFLNNKPKYELVTNRYPLTYPDGLDVDVMDIKSLENANKNATDKKHKEHIVPYFWESGRKFLNFEDVENGFKKYRWTIDYKEDFLVIDEIIKNLYPKYGNNYVTKDVLDFLDSNHEISKINSHYIK